MLQCQNITKNYHSGRGIMYALRGVSFAADQASMVVIVGKSGSGKTTLLNCLGGLDRPDSGSVLYGGRNLHGLSARELSLFQRRETGFVFQFGNLLSYLNVSENISFPLTLNNIGEREKKYRVKELLERIGLPGAGPALPHELSGGEVQRVAVARALAHQPKLLLADEPTASLDSATGRSLIGLMFSMGREGGCTMVLATHDTEVIDLADQCIRLRDGSVQESE